MFHVAARRATVVQICDSVKVLKRRLRRVNKNRGKKLRRGFLLQDTRFVVTPCFPEVISRRAHVDIVVHRRRNLKAHRYRLTNMLNFALINRGERLEIVGRLWHYFGVPTFLRFVVSATARPVQNSYRRFVFILAASRRPSSGRGHAYKVDGASSFAFGVAIFRVPLNWCLFFYLFSNVVEDPCRIVPTFGGQRGKSPTHNETFLDGTSVCGGYRLLPRKYGRTGWLYL